MPVEKPRVTFVSPITPEQAERMSLRAEYAVLDVLLEAQTDAPQKAALRHAMARIDLACITDPELSKLWLLTAELLNDGPWTFDDSSYSDYVLSPNGPVCEVRGIDRGIFERIGRYIEATQPTRLRALLERLEQGRAEPKMPAHVAAVIKAALNYTQETTIDDEKASDFNGDLDEAEEYMEKHYP